MPTLDEMTEAMWPGHEAERSYIAALLSRDDTNEVLWRSEIEPVHMENGEYATILEAMIAVRDRGERVHFLTVAEQLADIRIEVAMWNSTNHWANPALAEFFAEQVMARYRRRSVRDLGQALGEIAADTPGPQLDDTVEATVESVLARPAVRAEMYPTDRSLAARAFGERVGERLLSTPWPRLDRAIKGFGRTRLYTLSGDTGSGKSAIALQCAYALAQQGPVLYFSMEMAEPELQDRLIAQQCGVSLDLVERQHFPDKPVRDRVERFVHDTAVPIIFDDRTTVTLSEIRRTALSVGDGLAGIVVDQLSLMDLGMKRGENLTDAIGRAVYGLKNLAGDLKIPVLMLSQLNREASRAGRPTRHHLFGSSAIANASDVILILHREDPSREEALTMYVDKNRQGPEVNIDLQWQGAFVRAYDPTS